jgi:hypothetical protein
MRIAIPIATLLFLAACTGDEPTVEIVSATPEALLTEDDANDDLTLVVRYEDPNGDLGGGVARVHDCRSESVMTELALPAIANEDGVQTEISMSGELQLVLADVGAIPEATLPEACDFGGVGPGAFCVVLVDAAGNESDPACTDVLAIK